MGSLSQYFFNTFLRQFKPVYCNFFMSILETQMNNIKYKVLIVEDSKTLLQVETDAVAANKELEVVQATSYAQTKQILEESADELLCALLDLSLPDAPDGEVVELVASYNVPSIAYTGTFDENIRDAILEKGAMDYVLKNSSASLEYISSLITYIYHNQNAKALVVDDSRTMREMLNMLLSSHRFSVLLASDGLEALEIVRANSDIKLIITDENMPNMRGSEFIKEIRKTRGQNELCIIGLSAHGNSFMSVDFLKNGANDFITKPFREEEFVCRVLQSMTMLRHVSLEKDRNRLQEQNHQKDVELLNMARHSALGKLTSNIAHHWRQPLGALSANIQDIYDSALDDNVVEEFQNESLLALKKMSRIIDDFSDTFIDDKNKVDFAINGSIRAVIELLSEELAENKIEILTDIEDAIINGYEKEFRLIVYYILSNSINILKDRRVESPLIKISVTKRESECHIVVSDNGGGVPNDVIESIFDPFFSTTPYQDRMGMGLFYAKVFIEKSFGGTITVDNSRQGAVFTICYRYSEK
jgi:DNA-binding response OmpR family regulator/two-component sensor histidine kinase